MNNNYLKKAILAFILSALSHTCGAQNCITQEQDFNFIIKSKQQGLLRFENDYSHQPFSYDEQTPFNEYLNYAYQHIKKANPRADLPCPVATQTYLQLIAQGDRKVVPTIADIIAPFELTQANNKKVVLLIHGLTDSPFVYHDLAQVYYRQGYNVRTILLPGHATAPNALKNVNLQQWQQVLKYSIERSEKDFDEVILGGYSTGATLIIDYLTKQTLSPKIKALMLFSPASEPHNKNAWLAKWVDAIPFVDWLNKDADIDFAKYESFPLNAATTSYNAMLLVSIEKLKKRPGLELPIFSALSDIDTTIDSLVSFKLLSVLHNRNSIQYKQLDTLVLYGNKASLPAYFTDDYTVLNPQCTNAVCKNIHGVSHVSIMNSPENPHYGIDAPYRNCSRFINNANLYKACKTTKNPQLGEHTVANLIKYPILQRLTYNPYFNELEIQINTFIKRIEKAQGKSL